MKVTRKILLLLDFDGTLSPIVKDPKDAVLPENVKLWLSAIARDKNFRLGIVTGRSLSDIKRRVGIRNLIYAANHGMEIFYNGKNLLCKGRSFRKPLQLLVQQLGEKLSPISGVIVENKGLSVAVHFRKVGRNQRAVVRNLVREVAAPYIKKNQLQLTVGKMILEVRPAKIWNKGDAVLWIWKKLAPKFIPIYLGDDVTDEDAFLAIKPYGVGVRIGRKKSSHAQYQINSIQEFINHDDILA